MAATLPTKNNPTPKWFARAKANSFLVQADNQGCHARSGDVREHGSAQRLLTDHKCRCNMAKNRQQKNPLDGGFSGLLAATTQWRPRSESNRRTRLCRPLTYVIYHSLTAFDTHFATRSGVCFRPRLCENTELPSSMCRLHCLLINNSLYFFTERSCRFRSG